MHVWKGTDSSECTKQWAWVQYLWYLDLILKSTGIVICVRRMVKCIRVRHATCVIHNVYAVGI